MLIYDCRLNFSLEDLAVVNPYYKHFKSCLNSSYPTTNKGSGELLTFKTEQILTNFPQCSNYDRVKELVCINISLCTLLMSSTVYRNY